MGDVRRVLEGEQRGAGGGERTDVLLLPAGLRAEEQADRGAHRHQHDVALSPCVEGEVQHPAGGGVGPGGGRGDAAEDARGAEELHAGVRTVHAREQLQQHVALLRDGGHHLQGDGGEPADVGACGDDRAGGDAAAGSGIYRGVRGAADGRVNSGVDSDHGAEPERHHQHVHGDECGNRRGLHRTRHARVRGDGWRGSLGRRARCGCGVEDGSFADDVGADDVPGGADAGDGAGAVEPRLLHDDERCGGVRTAVRTAAAAGDSVTDQPLLRGAGEGGVADDAAAAGRGGGGAGEDAQSRRASPPSEERG